MRCVLSAIVSAFALAYNDAVNLGRDKTVQQIISRLESAGSGGTVRVEGTWGSFGPMLVAHISANIERPILYVRPHIDDADRAADDLHTFGGRRVEAFGAWEGEEDLADATDEIRAQRLTLVSRLGAGEFLVPASVQSLCQPIPKPEAIEKGSLGLEVDRDVPPEDVVEWLVENGFERTERVDLPGQFARRGGIVDIYAPVINDKVLMGGKTEVSAQDAEAVRIEFFGDTIESIRQINLDTQRSSNQIRSLRIVSAVCGSSADQRELLVNVLPKDTIIVLEEPGEIEEVAKVFLDRSDDASRLYSWADIHEAAGNFTQLHICRFATAEPEDFIKVDIKSVQQFQHKATSVWAGHKAALEELVQEAKNGKEVQLYCESSAEIKRVGEIVQDIAEKAPAKLKLLLGFIHQGFVVNSLDTIVISHHELFGQYALRRRRRGARATSPVDTLSDLQEGDYVVHASYGIGRFAGVQAIQETGGTNEYLTIEYADKAKIQVSVRNIALVQKYIGTSPTRPRLSKVGSKRWLKQKAKVESAVRDLACDLLDIQAKRQAAGGIALGEDSNWQVEFEESFPYQETPDQTIAAGQIKVDMQQAAVMDRLLCGDVGYGKTELAMRAAFKAIENGKQVAILTPT
ncbi:MAG: hypothetical protein JSW47_08730, partial [Phycisphaerales bacterium]